jgi:hypothetical protein
MKGCSAGAEPPEWLVESLYGFLRASLARIWSSGRFGFWRLSSSSFCRQIGSASFPGWHHWVGGHKTPYGFVVDQPLFRGANADLNLTFAMAIIFSLVDRLVAAGSWSDRIHEGIVCAEG